jgi:rod shape-determining protein MreD
MSLLLAAVGATAAALIELTVVVPYLRVGDAYPHLVLVLGVIWTVASGIEGGLVWAFVGGLVLDVLAQRPIGSTAFALLVAAGGAAVVAQFLSRLRPLVPIVAVAILSLVYSMTSFLLLGALRTPVPDPDPVGTLLPGVAYDTILAVVFGPLVVAIHDRVVETERVDW